LENFLTFTKLPRPKRFRIEGGEKVLFPPPFLDAGNQTFPSELGVKEVMIGIGTPLVDLNLLCKISLGKNLRADFSELWKVLPNLTDYGRW